MHLIEIFETLATHKNVNTKNSDYSKEWKHIRYTPRPQTKRVYFFSEHVTGIYRNHTRHWYHWANNITYDCCSGLKTADLRSRLLSVRDRISHHRRKIYTGNLCSLLSKISTYLFRFIRSTVLFRDWRVPQWLKTRKPVLFPRHSCFYSIAHATVHNNVLWNCYYALHFLATL